MARTLQITVQTGEHRNQRFRCGLNDNYLIGRGSDCQVPLRGSVRDQLISRHHCRLSMNSSFLKIQDLDSRNGTYLNGKRIGLVQFRLHDTVTPSKCGFDCEAFESALLTVGDTTLKLELLDTPNGQTPARGTQPYPLGPPLQTPMASRDLL